MRTGIEMNKRTKIYIATIVVLLLIIIAKPIIDQVSGSKDESFGISFREASVRNLRLLEEMRDSECISDFDYDVSDKKAVVYATTSQMKKGKLFIKEKADDIITETEDNYEISVNDSMDEFTVMADSDMDFKLVFDDYASMIEACQIYQKFCGNESWKCRGIIKNRETGVVITDSVQPGQSIDYDVTDITGVGDTEKAIEIFNNNNYTKILYEKSSIEDGLFISATGEFELEIPENAVVVTEGDLEKINELEPGYTAYDLKSRLVNGYPVRELEIVINDDTRLIVSVNYSESQYDKEYYDEFIRTTMYDSLSSEYSDAELLKCNFIGQECNLIKCKDGDEYNYMVFWYNNGFSYTIWGKYNSSEDEQIITEMMSSFRKVN